jgi:predicted esterase
MSVEVCLDYLWLHIADTHHVTSRLQGLGDQGTSFVPMAHMLGRQFPNLKFILPSAKSIPITMNSGYKMPG